MSTKEIEVILMRQLASYLAMPVFLVDPKGTLIFYNEPAEIILGHTFDETGEMPMEEWATIFTPTDDHGAPLEKEELPLVIALMERRPAHRGFWIQGLDHMSRYIEVTALPIIGQSDRLLGAAALFWEMGPAGDGEAQKG